MLENSGRQDVESLKLTLSGALNVENVDVLQAVPRSETEKVSLDYKKQYLGVLQKLKITPVVIEDEEEVICPTDKSLTIENVPECI